MQKELTNNDFYIVDSKVYDIENGLGSIEFGLDRDVNDLCGGK
ncbi:hypothetical protein [Sporosarcina sp. ANT_H38]|nr:hypothetical protein [Sporosarcina sp. ANT_H38]